ncbi:MFS transporter [Histoplasma capsulatum var. duboisii H88]|uniref:MFS transporter n=2 Tax=Ajellomyces capsulatus TaxID=5037 RepID=F0ULM5_AJEC8|nr:MFS transporter [Histoplasma capsulatum H143]EGC47179.1 MFS transporter [Histoplasma capsulatum var. duboisii H88]QSS53356.1 MFS transporter [Histoplasma capsulatum var. duboisii H88]
MVGQGSSRQPSSDASDHVKMTIDDSGNPIDNLEAAAGKEGYLLDTSHARSGDLKTTQDGRTILIPQPSASPLDPLNWSWARKHLILIIVSMTAFLPDYGSATGAVTLLPQSAIWKMTPDEVNHSQVGNVFMLGAGGVFVVALAAYFGRYPVFFWFAIIATATAVWCTAAQTFESFMAARILNGFFSTVAQGGGLMFIKDLFFFHEHARKINIWSSFIIVSPYLGPLFTAFIINTQIWQWAFGVYTIMTALCLALIIFCIDETYYDRKLPESQQPPRGPQWKRMVGIEQWHSRHLRNTFKDACMRPLIIICKPPVFISMVYYLLTFAWVVGINTTLSIFLGPLYNFGPKQIGFFYFTPVTAAILGEIAGHWLHDLIARTAARRNNGRLEPESRYIATWIATPFMFAGLILLGFALEREYHYMLASLGWGLYVFGIMITTVAVNAYVLDSYPEASGEVAAWINFGRTTGGFVVSYFMVRWAHEQGTIRQFGTMTGICGFAFLMVLGLQIFGKRMRLWAGPAKFKTV